MILTMILLFVVGYAFIALEHKVKVDKSAIALLMRSHMDDLQPLGAR